MHLPDPVDYAVPFFILLVLAEMLVAWARGPPALRAARHADIADARDRQLGRRAC